MPRARLFVVLLALFAFSIPSTKFISAQRSALDTYAITNTRIVTVSGPVVERGTIVIRDGLIVAVGEKVSAPADARVIDGTGLTVYPGLIDSNTNLGLPAPSPAPSPMGGAGGGFLQALGTTIDVKALLMRIVDYLKNQEITTLFTSLMHEQATDDPSVSSLIDNWVQLRNIELWPPFNRVTVFA